jgi:hypothetical protein
MVHGAPYFFDIDFECDDSVGELVEQIVHLPVLLVDEIGLLVAGQFIPGPPPIAPVLRARWVSYDSSTWRTFRPSA